MSARFEQIEIEPAYRKVASALRDRIHDRTLRDGERLPSEAELARQFGVNRSTVREALRELQTSGILARRPGSKRLAVTRPEPSVIAEGVSRALALHDVTYFDLWEALTILEPTIAECAARRRTSEHLLLIASAVERFAAEKSDTAQAVLHVAEFFRQVGLATGNPVLPLAQDPLIRLLQSSLRAMLGELPQARDRILTAQRHILAALQASDARAARTWMARHIRDFRRGYQLAGIALSAQAHVELKRARRRTGRRDSMQLVQPRGGNPP